MLENKSFYLCAVMGFIMSLSSCSDASSNEVSTGKSGGGFSAYPALTGIALKYSPNGAESGFVIVNLSSISANLNVSQGTGQIQSVSAPNLSSNIVTGNSLSLTSRSVDMNQITVAPYSVNFIKK